jgi:hypothetical protein
MSDLLDQFPEVQEQLDPDLKIVSAREKTEDGERKLEVFQRGEFEAEKSVFLWNGFEWDLDPEEPDRKILPEGEQNLWRNTPCTKSTDEDHRLVYGGMTDQVGRDTSLGPDHGNLACLWAVRMIVHDVLGRWITKSDYTLTFNEELRQCYDKLWSEAELLEGAIIISPTTVIRLPNGKRRKSVGHVGLLSLRAPHGEREVYSNSSTLARWKKSHTLNTWREYYQVRKGLEVLYYPLPFRRTVDVA